MKPPEIFETDRLALRKPRPEDAEAVFAEYAQDREVTKFLTWRPHENIEETREFIKTCVADWEGGPTFTWSITQKSANRTIGMIALRIHGFKADFGYVLAREYWGRGVVTEALKAVTRWAENQPEIHRIWSVCDVENVASSRVMEKAGLEKEGVLHRWLAHPNAGEAPRDCFCYAKWT